METLSGQEVRRSITELVRTFTGKSQPGLCVCFLEKSITHHRRMIDESSDTNIDANYKYFPNPFFFHLSHIVHNDTMLQWTKTVFTC